MKANAALCAALVVAFSGGARADEGAKVKLTVREHWKAGDVVTRKGASVEKEEQKLTSAEEKVLDEGATETTTNYERVEKVVAADAAGRRTKTIVHFLSFTRVMGKDRDESLKGITIEVNGTGPAAKWTVLGDVVLDEPAKVWIDHELGAESDEDDTSDFLSPKGEVAAGEAYEFDVKGLANSIGKHVPSQTDAAAGKAKLEGLADDVATTTIEFELQTKVLPTPQGPLPWVEGGKLTLKRRVVMKADGSAGVSEAKTDFEIGGKAKTADGGGLAYKSTATKTVTTVAGGEIPAPPQPKLPAPDPPGPDKPVPDKPAPDKPVPDKPVPDKPAPDKPGPGKPEK